MPDFLKVRQHLYSNCSQYDLQIVRACGKGLQRNAWLLMRTVGPGSPTMHWPAVTTSSELSQ